MDTNFKKITFLTKEGPMEVSIKKEFHQAACKHDFKKGKIIRPKGKRIFSSRLPKDTTICIKCGKKGGKNANA